jgi:hypothetical protein
VLQLCLLIASAVSEHSVKLVQTFEEEQFLLSKPASEKQQALVDQVFSQMKNEFETETTSLLKANGLKSKLLNENDNFLTGTKNLHK